MHLKKDSKRLESEQILENKKISYLNYIVHLSRYAFASNHCKGKNVLELGCGVGYGSYFLLKKGAKMVIGIDISKSAIRLAKNFCHCDSVDFVITDAADLPFRNYCFDVITSMGVLDHLPSVLSTIRECRRVLRDEGKFICSVLNRLFITPIPSIRTFDPFHAKEFTYDELNNLLRTYFEDVQGFGLIYGGKYWWQMRSIIDFLLRKISISENTNRQLSRTFFPSIYKTLTYSTDLAIRDPAIKNCLTKIRSNKEKSLAASILFTCTVWHLYEGD